jgi:hypothetical protein
MGDVQERSGLLKVTRVKALGEPAKGGCECLVSIISPALALS